MKKLLYSAPRVLRQELATFYRSAYMYRHICVYVSLYNRHVNILTLFTLDIYFYVLCVLFSSHFPIYLFIGANLIYLMEGTGVMGR
jgi:hypothetical protein